MRGLRLCLTPFAPDQSGAVSVLYEMGGLVVVIDAGGCAGNICGFDEPRWRSSKSAVFSAGLRDIDAILGRDDLLVEKVERACGEVEASFVALVGTPVPAVLGTDYRALSRVIARRCGMPCLTVAANGLGLYDAGAEKAWREAFRTFVRRDEPRVAGRVGVLGLTPMDVGDLAAARAAVAGRAGTDDLLLFGVAGDGEARGDYAGVARAASVERNLVVAPSGIAAARYMQRELGIPYQLDYPVADALVSAAHVADGERVLVVHQAVAARSFAAVVEARGADASVTCATWFMAPEECGLLRQLREEDDFSALVGEGDFDVVVADRVLEPLARGFAGRWVDAPHFAVSGRH